MKRSQGLRRAGVLAAWWALGGVLPASAQTAPSTAPALLQPKPADFAAQLPLAVSGENGVVQFRLPLEVYQRALSADLGDVRVFNAAGRALPFAFIDAVPSERVRWRDSTARLFPIHGPAAVSHSLQSQLEVTVAADGALVSVRSRSGSSSSDALNALVLDLGTAAGDEVLDSLQLTLPNTATYRAELVIDRSDDLKLWDRVAQSRIDRLRGSQPDEELLNDRIQVATRAGRYLRIQWLEGTPVVFERIALRWRSIEAVTDLPLEVQLTSTPGNRAGELLYAASPSMAATQVGLSLPAANSVVPASIGFYDSFSRRSRASPAPDFIPIAQGTFYRLTQSGRERTSSYIQIAQQSSEQWVVRLADAAEAPPELVLRWHPRTLIFTARGTSATDRNFILAVGARQQQLKQWLTSRTSIDRVAPGFSVAELSQAERAVAGRWQDGGTPVVAASEVTPPSTRLLQDRSWILWAVLIIGALLLGAMCWRLYTQMQRDSP